jgi:hypothetical protein
MGSSFVRPSVRPVPWEVPFRHQPNKCVYERLDLYFALLRGDWAGLRLFLFTPSVAVNVVEDLSDDVRRRRRHLRSRPPRGTS